MRGVVARCATIPAHDRNRLAPNLGQGATDTSLVGTYTCAASCTEVPVRRQNLALARYGRRDHARVCTQKMSPSAYRWPRKFFTDLLVVLPGLRIPDLSRQSTAPITTQSWLAKVGRQGDPAPTVGMLFVGTGGDGKRPRLGGFVAALLARASCRTPPAGKRPGCDLGRPSTSANASRTLAGERRTKNELRLAAPSCHGRRMDP